MPGKITLYRVTNPGDSLATIAASEKIQFDVDVDPALATAKCHDWYVEGGRDVAQNPIADEDLSEHQDTGLGDEVYYLLISISNRSNGVAGGTNAEASKLEGFYQGGSENDNFPAGRFGIQINDFVVKNLVPSTTKGLYFKYRKWYVDAELPNPVFAVLMFSENRDS